MFTVIVAIIVVALLVLVWYVDPGLRSLRRFEAELAAREPLSDSAMLSEFFATENVSSDVPVRVRQILAEHMEYEAEKLRPDDNLDVYWNDLDMVYVFQEFETTFGIKIANKDLKNVTCTIRSLSQLILDKKCVA